jgi:PilZ domain
MDTAADVFAGGESFRVRVLDVSIGGARLLVDEPIGEWGDEVHLRLPNSEKVIVRGTIVRVQQTDEGYALGLRFGALGTEERACVAALTRS